MSEVYIINIQIIITPTPSSQEFSFNNITLRDLGLSDRNTASGKGSGSNMITAINCVNSCEVVPSVEI